MVLLVLICTYFLANTHARAHTFTKPKEHLIRQYISQVKVLAAKPEGLGSILKTSLVAMREPNPMGHHLTSTHIPWHSPSATPHKIDKYMLLKN